jgi:hypothetical protein
MNELRASGIGTPPWATTVLVDAEKVATRIVFGLCFDGGVAKTAKEDSTRPSS